MKLSASLAGLSVTLWSAYAAAYDYNYTCNGYPGTVGDSQISMKRNIQSIPNASPSANDLGSTVTEWNDSKVMLWAPLIVGGTQNDSTITYGDGTWEIALVDRSTIGSDGLTHSIYGTCFIGPNDRDEADIMISDDMPFGNPDSSLWDWQVYGTLSARKTFMHEWGHALGLDHVSGFAMMKTGISARIGGNFSHVTPFGDDRNGARSMYGNPPRR